MPMCRTHRPGQVVLRMFGCLAVAAAIGCSDSGEDPRDRKEGAEPFVAQVGERRMLVAGFRDYLADRLPSGTPVAREAVEARLEEWVWEEILYQEALRLDPDRDLEMLTRDRAQLIQRLLDDQVNRLAWSREIGEFELRAFYDGHRDEFQRPEQVRVADIFVAVSPEASGEERAVRRKRAEDALAEARASLHLRNGFSRLVEQYSDEPVGYVKGDPGFFGIMGEPGRVPRELAEAAFSLEGNGSLYERVVVAEDGYHVILRTGKRTALHLPFEQVRHRLEQSIREGERERTRREYLTYIRAAADVRVDRDTLAALTAELGAEESILASRESGSAGPQAAPPSLPASHQ